MWWLIIVGVIVAFLAVLIIRAAMFRPKKEEPVAAEAVEFDRQKAVDDLRKMIQCKTVSYRDPELIDETEFDKFRALLPELYPNVFKTCEYQRIGKNGLLFRWKGEDPSFPSVLMSHYDVVPVNESEWSKPAFDGIIEDNVLWGRGTLDTKSTLCGVMESCEHMIQQGFVPKHDIYMAFSGEEEVNGQSANDIVDYFKDRNIEIGLVIDEGGAVVEGIFPGVDKECALVGIAEKGMSFVEFSYTGNGGHASSPLPHTPIGILSKAVCDVENHPFEMRITEPVRKMFDTLGRHSTFVYKLIFSNLWCFKPVLNLITRKKGGELNALVRTSCAFTMMEGSKAHNVIPPHATVSANLRMVKGNDMDYVVERLKKTVNNKDVKIRLIDGQNPSIFSSTDCDGWSKVKNAIRQQWPDAIVSPYLMIACSDSRHYNRISDKVYRFSAAKLSKEERSLIHGNNERIKLSTITEICEFYIRLVKQL